MSLLRKLDHILQSFTSSNRPIMLVLYKYALTRSVPSGLNMYVSKNTRPWPDLKLCGAAVLPLGNKINILHLLFIRGVRI